MKQILNLLKEGEAVNKSLEPTIDLAKIKNTWDLQKTQKIASEANKETKENTGASSAEDCLSSGSRTKLGKKRSKGVDGGYDDNPVPLKNIANISKLEKPVPIKLEPI